VSLRRLGAAAPAVELAFFRAPEIASNPQDFRAKKSPKLDPKKGQIGRLFALYMGESSNKGSNQNAVT
jgi:hypothetical protein